jgi:hypothetical protein
MSWINGATVTGQQILINLVATKMLRSETYDNVSRSHA